MPPKYTSLSAVNPTFPEKTVTPEEQADTDARRILNEYGYVHSGQVIEYTEAVEILREVILKNQK